MAMLEGIVAGTWEPTPAERTRLEAENAAAASSARDVIVGHLRRAAGETTEATP
jgi:hypothetical protein